MFMEEINMRLSSRINKKMIIASLVVVLLILVSALAHQAYAGKKLSLNSPASFPVDI